MRNFKKAITGIISIASSFSLLVGCGSTNSTTAAGTNAAASAETASENSSAETKSDSLGTIRVAEMTNGDLQWVTSVGVKEGIFEKYGLTIEETEFSTGINTADAIALGQADIGTLADYALINRLGASENVNIKVLATSSRSKGDSDGSTYLYVNPDKVDKDNLSESLKTATLATATGTVHDYWVDKTYEYLNIPEKDRQIVQLGSFADEYAAALADKVDSVWANGVNASKLKEHGYVAALSQDDVGISTNGTIVTTDEFIKVNEDKVSAFLKAYEETVDFINENKDKAAEDIEELHQTPKDTFLASLDAEDIHLGFSKDDIDHLNDIKSWAEKNNKLKNDYNLEDYLSFDLLEEALPGSVEK